MAHKFVDNEAEHSGNESAGGEDRNEPNEYDLNDEFINDDEFIAPYPRPILGFREDRGPRIEEPPTPPPAPPPPPPPGGAGAPPPPVKPPAKKPPSDWVEPKHKKDKRMCQQVHTLLLPAVHVGYLTFVLVTVIPDPRESLKDAWENVLRRRDTLINIAKLIPGLFCFLIAIETHGAAHPKKATKRKARDVNEEAFRAEMQEALQNTPLDPSIDPTGPGKLAGKPHFHCLLYYPKLNVDQYNISYYKQRIQQELPQSDVNEVALRDHRRHSADPDFVRACSYVLKGNNCPATLRYWRKYVNPLGAPLLPELIAGEKFGYNPGANNLQLEESKRFLELVKQLPNYCFTEIPLHLAAAPPTFGTATKLSKKGQMVLQLANILNENKIYVGGDDSDLFYQRATHPNYQVLCTYTQVHTLVTLRRWLSTLPAAMEMLVSFGNEMASWFNFSQFKHIPPPKYDYVELQDAVYGVRTGLYHPKSDDRVCFRAYGYLAVNLQQAIPHDWLALVRYICTPRVLIRRNPPEHDTLSQPINEDKLLTYLAYLLRPRLPKQKVLYLWGKSNCGKTTLVSFLTQLYPKEAIGFLNRSCVALSGITENIACIWADEFDVGSIPRADLLMLTDGSAHLPVRKMHQDARLIEHPRCSMIFTSNPCPKYKDDDSKALENRFEMVHCENVLREDKLTQARIFESHLIIVAWLNRYLQPIEEQEDARRALEDYMRECAIGAGY